MKTFLTLLFIVAALQMNAQQKETPLKIMSYNIRLDYHGDSTHGDGWEQRRKKHVLALISHYDPDLFGVQEAKKNQMDDLLENLTGYAYIGVGRDDGAEAGEYSAIFYKKDRFEVLEENTFWLSETPEKPSKAWDAALPRIVTWGKFKDKGSDKEFYYFNTHFDHIGEVARAESARLITYKVEALTNNAPVIVSGDFNATPDAEPYVIMTDKLRDASNTSKSPAYGPEGTFSGFDLKPTDSFPRIDYIFVQDVEVLSYETIADYNGDKFPSDHLPVMTEVLLK